MKTLADLKRDAQNGIEFELVERFGSTDIPANISGRRKVLKVQTNAIVLEKDGKKSWLDLPKASLCEYTGDKLIFYKAGIRELTADEQAVMDEWKAIANTDENKENSYRDAMTDGSTMFYKEKHFFTDKGYEYLLCYSGFVRGKKYDCNTGKIKDETIRGDRELVYNIYQ